MPISERRLKAAAFSAAALGLVAAGSLFWRSADVSDGGGAGVATVVVQAVQAPPAHNAPDRRLTSQMRAFVRGAISEAVDAGLSAGSTNVAVVVKELGTNGELVDISGDRSFRPASNLKLATTAAALTLLGADASFSTHFDSSSEPSGGVLEADLIVRAGSDPLFSEESAGRVIPMLEPWVSALRASGVAEVRGDLVLDLGTFPEPVQPTGWPDSSQHWQDYCALSSGFSANGGCVSVSVEAGQAGAPARVVVSPSSYGMALDVAVSTTARRSALTVSAVVSEGRVRVRGNIPADVPSYVRSFAHPDPVKLFGGVLRRALAQGGIRIDGDVEVRRGVVAPIRLASLNRPIIDALVPINTHSNNAVADQLFMKLGADVLSDGSRSGGERAVLTALERLGVDSAGWRQVGGSGLSRDNRVSARQLVMLIDSVLDSDGEVADAYARSLAVAGQSGTLSDRMSGGVAEGRVLAKTGFIGGTSALSGLARGLSGRVYVFSVLVNYPVRGGLNRTVWKPMQDSICELIVSDG